ncbi:MAG: hypothetical protein OER87_01760 [Gammaproteobacteria bacterium]|nr:hypothetical protein [Gammaproteobacteria bacterium]
MLFKKYRQAGITEDVYREGIHRDRISESLEADYGGRFSVRLYQAFGGSYLRAVWPIDGRKQSVTSW